MVKAINALSKEISEETTLYMPASRASRTRLIDITAAAERLGVSVRYIRRLVAQRRIPYVKLGHYLRFDDAELDEWIDRSRVAAFDPGSRPRGA